jgi:hypothetical protein
MIAAWTVADMVPTTPGTLPGSGKLTLAGLACDCASTRTLAKPSLALSGDPTGDPVQDSAATAGATVAWAGREIWANAPAVKNPAPDRTAHTVAIATW